MLSADFKNIKSTPKELRSFGLTVGIGFLILAFILWRLDREIFSYLVWLGSFLIVIGIALPVVLKPFQKIWVIFSILLGWFMTRVILAILFYIGFTATRILGSIFGKKFLDLKMDKKETYWIYRESTNSDKNTYEKQF